jgi:hypothetical protein
LRRRTGHRSPIVRISFSTVFLATRHPWRIRTARTRRCLWAPFALVNAARMASLRSACGSTRLSRCRWS